MACRAAGNRGRISSRNTLRCGRAAPVVPVSLRGRATGVVFTPVVFTGVLSVRRSTSLSWFFVRQLVCGRSHVGRFTQEVCHRSRAAPDLKVCRKNGSREFRADFSRFLRLWFLFCHFLPVSGWTHFASRIERPLSLFFFPAIPSLSRTSAPSSSNC